MTARRTLQSSTALPIFAVGDFDPVLMAPDQTTRVTACMQALSSHERAKDLLTSSVGFASVGVDDYWPQANDWQYAYKPYIVKAGVLQIPVKGILLHNFPFQVGSYATGYYYIQKAMERGLADPQVRGIALVCDSPGGHVAGCFELVDRIYAARKIKPVEAFAHEIAMSAAYAVASAAKKITVSKTGGVGSIGVVTMHINFAKALEMEGVEITFIYAGKHKKDGNPYEALSEDAKARIQTRIDETYGIFVASVARNRSQDEKTIRKTEALTFTATEAVDQKLADKIGPLDEAMAEFSACLMGEGDDQMTTPTNTVAQADHDKAVNDARSEAAAAERARITGIKALPEAKDRPLAADSVAMNTAMSVEAAKAFLATLPVEKAAVVEAPKSANSGNPDFSKAMDQTRPGPGATTGDEANMTQDQKDAAVASRILASKFGTPTPPSTAKH